MGLNDSLRRRRAKYKQLNFLSKYKIQFEKIGILFLLIILLTDNKYVIMADAADSWIYTVTGANGNAISLDDLKNRFRSNNIQIQSNDCTYALEAARYDEALAIMNALATTDSKYADAALQVDLYQFSKFYQANLTESANDQLIGEFIKNCYQLMVNQEERSYYSAYSDYLSVNYYIATKKYNKGYINYESLAQIQADIDTNYSNFIENQYNKDSIEFNIGLGTNTINIPISQHDKVYQEANVIHLFKAKDFHSEEIANTILAYQNYLLNAKLTSGSATYKKISLQILDYQLQQQKQEQDIEKYVKKGIKSYYLACRKCNDSKSKLNLASKEYTNAQMQYSKGKIAKVTMIKSLVAKEQKELEYYQNCYGKMVWEYSLDNGIYGLVP